MDTSDIEVDSVKDTNVKIEPEPTCGAGVVDSSALPENLNSSLEVSALEIDSVVLENPKSDPEPT